MISFSNFENEIGRPRILKNGDLCYQNGQVINTKYLGDGKYHGNVQSGSLTYIVQITIANNAIMYHSCDCKNVRNPMCKHIIAMLLKIKYEKDNIPESQEEFKSESDQNSMIIDYNEEGYNLMISKEEPEIFGLLTKKKDIQKVHAKVNKNKKKQKETSIVNYQKTNFDKIRSMTQDNPIDLCDQLTFTEKEFECQICLELFTNPVLMPCHAHSICLECLYRIYLTKKKESNCKLEGLKIECPTCGNDAGEIEFHKLKINKELIKIMECHAQDKKNWLKEKATLKQEEKKIEMMNSTDKKLRLALDNSSKDILQTVAFDALKLLINNGKNVDKFINIDLNIPIKNIKSYRNGSSDTKNNENDANVLKKHGNRVQKNKIPPNSEEELMAGLNEDKENSPKFNNTSNKTLIRNGRFKRIKLN